MGRWEHLYEARPVPVRAFVLDKVAEELAAELRAFPPASLDWVDAAERQRYAEVLARPTPPGLETLRVACELSRLELLHEVELIDRFLRGPLARELLPDPLEERSALFITRWFTEACLAFQEQSGGRVKRADLVQLIERIEDRLLRGYRLRLGAP